MAHAWRNIAKNIAALNPLCCLHAELLRLRLIIVTHQRTADLSVEREHFLRTVISLRVLIVGQ